MGLKVLLGATLYFGIGLGGFLCAYFRLGCRGLDMIGGDASLKGWTMFLGCFGVALLCLIGGVIGLALLYYNWDFLS